MLRVKIEYIAKMCHEANKAWCEINGDNSQKSWEEAAQWQRDSAIHGVKFRLNAPNCSVDTQHNVWMAEKVADGWIYGEEKDAIKMTHPFIVPFDELPAFQQTKDSIFCAMVSALSGDSTRDLSFGDAIKAAEKGERVAREGWNASGMFSYIVPASSYLAQTGAAKEYFGEGALVPYRAYWALKTAQEDVATWAPSGSDTLAKDWYIVKTPTKK